MCIQCALKSATAANRFSVSHPIRGNDSAAPCTWTQLRSGRLRRFRGGAGYCPAGPHPGRRAPPSLPIAFTTNRGLQLIDASPIAKNSQSSSGSPATTSTYENRVWSLESGVWSLEPGAWSLESIEYWGSQFVLATSALKWLFQMKTSRNENFSNHTLLSEWARVWASSQHRSPRLDTNLRHTHKLRG